MSSTPSEFEARELYLRTAFLERIAHDLRGPAGVTLGALSELELALELGEVGRIKDLLPMARRGLGRLLRTADQLERAGHLERGHVDWTMEVRDMRELVRIAAEQADRAEKRKGVSIVISTPDASCLAVVDSCWLTRAVCELLINALRHANTCAGVEVLSDDTEVRIIVTDDGKGFGAEPGARFDPSPGKHGLGLSISLARDVAKAHRGYLLIEQPLPDGASAGTGGRVSLVLPRSIEQRVTD